MINPMINSGDSKTQIVLKEDGEEGSDLKSSLERTTRAAPLFLSTHRTLRLPLLGLVRVELSGTGLTIISIMLPLIKQATESLLAAVLIQKMPDQEKV
mgnify:CR=1 FL=1